MPWPTSDRSNVLCVIMLNWWAMQGLSPLQRQIANIASDQLRRAAFMLSPIARKLQAGRIRTCTRAVPGSLLCQGASASFATAWKLEVPPGIEPGSLGLLQMHAGVTARARIRPLTHGIAIRFLPSTKIESSPWNRTTLPKISLSLHQE
jgi:hypothetical protein